MKNLIRGGQTATHSIRMASQLFFEIIRLGFIIVAVSVLAYSIKNISIYELKSVSIYYYAQFLNDFGAGKYEIKIMNSYGKEIVSSVSSIIKNPSLIELEATFIKRILDGLIIGIKLAIGSCFACIVWFSVKGNRFKKEKLIRGGKIVAEEKLKALISKKKSNNNSIPYFISPKVPYPANTESLHTLIMGSTGSGKTNAIFHLINQIRKNGHRAIIYDKMGVFTSCFYDENKDIILNPLDARSKSWSLFNEVINDSDFDYLAAAFIPEDGRGDPFWGIAARSIISITARKLKKQNPDATNKDLADLLLRSSHTQISNFLKNTDAATLADKSSEKTMMSIMSVISAYVRSISYLHDEGEKISIRRWIENDEEKGFLFISSKGDQHDSLKPVISAWIDVAVKSILSLDRKETRKIWIILDELPSLQALPSLLEGLSQSRQFGGAFVLSLQAVAHLRAIYGKDRASTILSLCRNRLFFSIPDNETAEYCSDDLGFQETEEIKENISYGAHEMRDGVNINFHKSTKRLVMPTELTMLDNLCAYLKFSGDLPITKVHFPKERVAEINPGFIQRKIVENKSEKSSPPEEKVVVEKEDDNSQKKIVSLFDD